MGHPHLLRPAYQRRVRIAKSRRPRRHPQQRNQHQRLHSPQVSLRPGQQYRRPEQRRPHEHPRLQHPKEQLRHLRRIPRLPLIGRQRSYRWFQASNPWPLLPNKQGKAPNQAIWSLFHVEARQSDQNHPDLPGNPLRLVLSRGQRWGASHAETVLQKAEVGYVNCVIAIDICCSLQAHLHIVRSQSNGEGARCR
jgi:hypothetical protein